MSEIKSHPLIVLVCIAIMVALAIKMIKKLVEWYLRRQEKTCIKRIGGIPIVLAIYKPEQDKPNVIFHIPPSIKHDVFLRVKFKEIADYIRENWKEWQDD